MEAGGFEPPSRDISGQASTYIVAFLSFTVDIAKRQALSIAISRLDSPLRHERTASAIPLSDAQRSPAGEDLKDGPPN
jgi:hypothetical protein